MDELLIIVVRGVGIGSLYGLIAIALNVAYNATGVLNFAQGQLLVLAGVMTYLWVPHGTGVADPVWWLAFIVVILAMALAGAVQGLVTLLPMRRKGGSHSWVPTTIAASVIIGALLILWIGPQVVHVPNYFGSVPVAGSTVPGAYLLLFVAMILIWAGLRWYQRKSLTGLALSAVSQDLDAARTAGVPTMRLQLFSFALAAGITAIAGFLGGSVIEVADSSGLHYTTFGFVVAVVGGIGNNVGAVIAGPLFGILLMFVTYQFGGGLQVVAALAVVIVVLMLKPEGIFGRPHARRV